MRKTLKQANGITLIALVITIIILIILSGVTINILIGQDGLIERTKNAVKEYEIESAKEKLELLKAPILLDEKTVNLNNFLQKLYEVETEYKLTDIQQIDEICATVIVNGKYKFLIEDEQNGNVKITYNGEVDEIGPITPNIGELILSETSGIVTYPETKTVTVTENESEGQLSVTSSDENIATASIDGNIVTIVPKAITEDGQKVTITVTSAATENYKEQTTTYEATVNRGIIDIEAITYTGDYDGQAHDAITQVSTTPEDTTLRYKLNNGDWKDEIPTVTNEGTYTILIEASKAGYVTKEIEKTITITRLAYAVTYKVDTSITYTENVKKGNDCLSPISFTPTKSGYTFVGWREDDTASPTVLSSKVMEDSAINLYAVFKKSITLSYNGNESTEGEIESQTEYKYYNNGNELGASFVLAENTFQKTDNKWIAWTKDSTQGTQYLNGDTILLNEDTTFYACWEETMIYLVKDGVITEAGEEWFENAQFTATCATNWRKI